MLGITSAVFHLGIEIELCLNLLLIMFTQLTDHHNTLIKAIKGLLWPLSEYCDDLSVV